MSRLTNDAVEIDMKICQKRFRFPQIVKIAGTENDFSPKALIRTFEVGISGMTDLAHRTKDNVRILLAAQALRQNVQTGNVWMTNL